MNYFFISFAGIGLRLQGPSSVNGTGRIEVFYQGKWGTICDDRWDFNDARVVCRQLGYLDAIEALQGRDVPDGTGRIWLDDVSCTGEEKSLKSCHHGGWGVHNCFHSEDAGVECLRPGKISLTNFHLFRPYYNFNGVDCNFFLFVIVVWFKSDCHSVQNVTRSTFSGRFLSNCVQ